MQAVSVECEIGGEVFKLETGRLAKQAHGAVLVQYGGTVVLTATVGGSPRGGGDFFPLTVDYRERTYAAGKFPGGFKKREGPPTMKEILTMRLTDRPIRPLFPEGYFNEVQIMTTVLSSDRQNDADMLSIAGASAALYVSPLPFLGPIAAVRLGRVEGKFVVLPTVAELEESDLDLVVAGTDEAVCMIEGFARELPEDDMEEAIRYAHGEIRKLVALQRELREKAGLPTPVAPEPADHALFDKMKEEFFEPVKAAKRTEGKQARAAAVEEVFTKVREKYAPAEGKEGPTPDEIGAALHTLEGAVVRNLILSGTRPDGRAADELRDLDSDVGLLPRTHGSALFQRGETQALMIATLGSPSDEQRVDGLADEYSKKFMLDYNFPPFSVGECRPIRGPGRREIGHGALAERSLKPVVPGPEKFPYTIRLVSEILESNGSSSMATVCAGTLCMMDAGVPIKDPVAGISIGLVKEGGNHVLLTDILGDEDHFGDMDFKIAGTQRGITGIQLDLKISGIDEGIIHKTLAQARSARIEILKHLLRTLNRPRKEISEYAPCLLTTRVNPEKIGMVIGPGGKHIRALQEETQSEISIQDDGTVTIASLDRANAEMAKDRIEAISQDVQVGKIYRGKVTAIKDFGAFVEIVPGRDGLCHISELDNGYVNKVGDVCAMGDILDVKVIAIDDHDRVKLSRKAVLNAEAENAEGGDKEE